MKRIALLGSTGSIGTQTLEVIRELNAAEPSFDVVALAAGQNLPRLGEQIRAFRPSRVNVAREADAARLRRQLDPDLANIAITAGSDGLEALAREAEADLVVNGLVGAIGLRPTLAALEANVDLALANKESLVIGGPLVRRAQDDSQARLIPIDSEHSALFQLLEGVPREDVAELVLTASGGALRDVPLDALADVTPDDVLSHPTWDMGARVTVDSATLVNKALEVIEAHWLFGWPYERIDAVIHPQSVVHGMLELVDGGVRAALSPPDMREPIQYALTHPERRARSADEASGRARTLEFRELDAARYPAFATVVAAGREGGTAPTVANAADEVLVERFLNGEIPFGQIATGLTEVIDAHDARAVADLDDLWQADRWARERAQELPPASPIHG